ncbi:enolase-phosphatase E1-like [Centruroides vittatus]|uniref:enolase-phosphatase E1-like n=1 Tax=Centruroides vittatus TaxID=120091 RepID=UPI00350EA8A4
MAKSKKKMKSNRSLNAESVHSSTRESSTSSGSRGSSNFSSGSDISESSRPEKEVINKKLDAVSTDVTKKKESKALAKLNSYDLKEKSKSPFLSLLPCLKGSSSSTFESASDEMSQKDETTAEQAEVRSIHSERSMEIEERKKIETYEAKIPPSENEKIDMIPLKSEVVKKTESSDEKKPKDIPTIVITPTEVSQTEDTKSIDTTFVEELNISSEHDDVNLKDATITTPEEQSAEDKVKPNFIQEYETDDISVTSEKEIKIIPPEIETMTLKSDDTKHSTIDEETTDYTTTGSIISAINDDTPLRTTATTATTTMTTITTTTTAKTDESKTRVQGILANQLTSHPAIFKIGADTITINAEKATPINKTSKTQRSVINIRMQQTESENLDQEGINIQLNEFTVPKKESPRKVKLNRGIISSDLNEIMKPLIDPNANIVVLSNSPLTTENTPNIEILSPSKEKLNPEKVVKTLKSKQAGRKISTVILPTYRADVRSYKSKEDIEHDKSLILAISPTDIPQQAAISEHVEDFSAMPDVKTPLVLIAPSPSELQRQKEECVEIQEDAEEQRWRKIAEEVAISLPETINDQPMVILMPDNTQCKNEAIEDEEEEIKTVVIVAATSMFPEQNVLEEESNQMFFPPVRETPTIVFLPSKSNYNIIKVNAASTCRPCHGAGIKITSPKVRMDTEENVTPLQNFSKRTVERTLDDRKDEKKDQHRNDEVKCKGIYKCYGFVRKKTKRKEAKDIAKKFVTSTKVQKEENGATNRALKRKEITVKKSLEEMEYLTKHDNLHRLKKVTSKVCVRIDNLKLPK